MTSTPEFRGAVHQNLYLAEGGREIHAVITVDTEEKTVTTPNGSGPAAAEVLILDCSSSMSRPSEKITQAKEAAAVAIDGLRDGVPFALIAGSNEARMLWPVAPMLVPADAQTRAAAKTALGRLHPEGGTTIGAWLRLAGELLGEHLGAIRHAILLTDGRNEHESPEELAAALRTCEGLFTCDCRGVGTDWSVTELRTIASALLGTVDLVAEPAGLAEDFRAMMATSMRRMVAEVGLRLWTPAGATVKFVTQTAPTLEDVSARRVEVGPQVGDYPTGSWGTESRDYHVCVEIEPGDVGEEKLACRMTFGHAGVEGAWQPLGQTFTHTDPDGRTKNLSSALVRAFWTTDLAQATMINDKVAMVTGKAELAKAIQDGLEAHRHGDSDHAMNCLGQALKLAEQCQDDNKRVQLNRIYDPRTRTFRLNKMSAREEMRLDIESTKTTPLRRG